MGGAGEEVVLAGGVGEEPDEFAGVVVGGDEFLEGVVEEVEAEDLQLVGLGDRVNLHVRRIYDADEVVGELAAVGRQDILRLAPRGGRERRPGRSPGRRVHVV